jgi:hypothetical protein
MAAVRKVSLALGMVAVSNGPSKVGMRCLVGRWIMSGRSQWPRGLKAWVCGRTLAVIVGWSPAGILDGCLMSVVCCQVEVCASG